MQMKTLKKYFTIWWIPIIAYLVPIAIYEIGNMLKNNHVISLSLNIFLINLLGNVVSSIVQIVIKKWYFTLPQILISAILIFWASIIFTYLIPDFYGANHIIPKNANCEKPAKIKILKKDLDGFKVAVDEGAQPGYYKYYVNFQSKENGYLYIKAYEITTNDPLSTELIKDRSKIMVKTLGKNFYSGTFTIYEGDGGDFYCARIEIWYKPDGGNEYKVNQKNYIVNGKER